MERNKRREDEIYAQSPQRSSLQRGRTNISGEEAANAVAQEQAAKDRNNFSSRTSLPKVTRSCSPRFVYFFLILKFEIYLVPTAH